jgi:hypothetical protein
LKTHFCVAIEILETGRQKQKQNQLIFLKQIFMEKKTITITASAAIINTITLILAPASTQRILCESFYLGTIKQTVTLWLS